MTPEREQAIRAKVLGIIHLHGGLFPSKIAPTESLAEWQEVLDKMVGDGTLACMPLHIDEKFPAQWYRLNA